MAYLGRDLRPAVDCNRLMMMMMISGMTEDGQRCWGCPRKRWRDELDVYCDEQFKVV